MIAINVRDWVRYTRKEVLISFTVCLYFRSRDFYHTCYCLSGLSVAQHFTGHLAERYVIGSSKNEVVTFVKLKYHLKAGVGSYFFPWGHMRNRKYCGGPGQKA